MGCKYFADLWAETQRAVPPKAFSVDAKATCDYPRFDLWWSKRPQGRHACKCGCSDDALRCWLRTQSDLLMGAKRSG